MVELEGMAEAPADVLMDVAPRIGFGSRVRKSPFFDATLRWGCKAYSTYNHMYMPLYYESPVADYWKLISDVTLWDVAVERQLEITGPDAAKFVQYLTPRNLSTMEVGQCKYVVICDQHGGVVNDPILLKLGQNHFWLSMADSDLLLWAKGLQVHSGFNVALSEPDVSPLQIQGPVSTQVMADLFGDWINDLKYYWFREAELEGMPLVISRTGWSNERGYEVFLRDGQYGDILWERIMAAGQPYGIAPAAPPTIRRVEAALLSYGADMDLGVNPLELGLGRLVDLEMPAEFVGKGALRRIAAEGPLRKLVGMTLGGAPLESPNEEPWSVLDAEGALAGKVTSAVYSPRLERNIALALLRQNIALEGSEFQVIAPSQQLSGTVVPIPFYNPKKLKAAS
jgi:aminomethyltransferase